MKQWSGMSDNEKMEHILETPTGVVPCNEKCKKCPMGHFKFCGDNVSHKRAQSWLTKNGKTK